MNAYPLVVASTLALAAAACGPATPPARAALECPATQGDLTRIALSADGKSCGYRAKDGAEVTLELVAANGDVDGALKALETRLLAERVASPAPSAAAAKSGTTSETPGNAATAAEKATREAEADTRGVEVSVGVKVDGVDHVTRGDGETRVNLPGISVVANEKDETARVRVGPLTVEAGDDQAVVRIRRDVRLRGEQLNPEKRGVRATFIYTGKDLPSGYRYVGYEAGGPKRGPITVAVVRARSENADGEELIPDVQKLVRRNGGV
jgi:hypothetical protein